MKTGHVNILKCDLEALATLIMLITHIFSGTLLSDSFYENWRPGHANRVYHNEEDCAILDPRTGRWDEVVCNGFLLDQQRHPWICQYSK